MTFLLGFGLIMLGAIFGALIISILVVGGQSDADLKHTECR